jgi:hypothetical protein
MEILTEIFLPPLALQTDIACRAFTGAIMNKRTLLAAIFFLVSATSSARAQQDVPPPPKQNGDQTSLETNLTFIEDTMNSIGKVSYVTYLHDDKTGGNWKSGVDTFEISGVRTSADNCRIDYHLLRTIGGKVILGPPSSETDHSFSLNEVQEVVVTPLARDMEARNAAGGHPEHRVRVDPLVFVMDARPSSGKSSYRLWFYDENTANRVAKALTGAVEICGEKRKALRNVDALGGKCATGDTGACGTLVSVATAGPDLPVRRAAVEQLDNQTVLTKLAAEDKDPGIREAAVNRLSNLAPILMQRAGDTSDVARIASESIARMNLAILEPRIRSRVLGLKCVTGTLQTRRDYSSFVGAPGFSVAGEKVTIRLDQDGSTLAEGSWSTLFPGTLYRSKAPSFLGAQVSGEDVLVKLLHLSAFSAEDLAELAHSSIPEVRIGAAANLADQALLAELATADRVPGVRKAAVGNLADQALVAKVATEDKYADVRKEAVGKLTNQAVLAKLATGDKDTDVRKAAAGRLTDQAPLAKLAAEDKDPGARKAAIKNLTDQSVLVRIATQDEDAGLRRSAVDNLTDQAVLAKVALEDKDWLVRLAAVKKLTDQAVLAKVATADKEYRARFAATERITDQALLGKLALEDEHWLVRLTAVGKLTDQPALGKIALEDKDSRVRKAAGDKLPCCHQ